MLAEVLALRTILLPMDLLRRTVFSFSMGSALVRQSPPDFRFE
jgi:hypothetical protein